VPEGTVEAYEGLRRQVVQPDGRGEGLESRRVLMRCGLAPWAQMISSAVPARTPESPLQSACESPVLLDSLGAELVRLVAGLILGIRQEGFVHV
jgi:hypothetical protein